MRPTTWIVPGALAAVAALAAFLIVPSPGHGPAQDALPAESPVAVAPDPDAPAADYTLLFVPPGGGAPEERTGFYEDGVFTPACDLVDPCPSLTLAQGAVSRTEPGPGFGVEGYVVVKASIVVFDSQGRLAYSNADAATQARFVKHPDFVDLPRLPVYLGNGSAPAGTMTLPASAKALFEPLRAQLVGLPAGAVATAILDSQTIRDVYGGPLYASARIDALDSA